MNQFFKIYRIETEEAEKIALSHDELHSHDFEELIIGMEGEMEKESVVKFSW